MIAPRSASPVQRARRARELEKELGDLRARLADAEATLDAIRRDEVDALVVVTREQGSEQVLTFGGAHVPWRHFVDGMRDGVLTVSEDGTILHASRRLSEMAGHDDIVGKPLSTLFEEDDKIRVLFQNAREEPLIAQTTLRRSSGELVPVEISATALPLDGVRRIGMIVTELATSGTQPVSYLSDAARIDAPSSIPDFEAAITHVPVGILSIDARSGVITYANRRAEEILGRPLVGLERGEVTSFRRDGTVVEPEQRPFARVLRGEAVAREEIAPLRADGTIVQTRTTAVPVHDDQGRISSVVLTLEDITEEMNARAERDANDRFRELFIGMLGHDLRDPLTTIVAGTSILRSRLTEPTEQRTLERLESATGRMTRMIDQILDFAQSRLGGGIPINRGPVNLHALVQNAVNDIHATHPKRAVETVLQGTGTGDWDADRLAQVVSNLLRNALEHGDRAEPIRVSVREHEEAWLRLDVHNGGSPIPKDLLPVIFDPFRRGSAGTGARGRGVGLGLYIAQQIVHAHGGTLSIASTDRDGTTFTVLLPRLAPASGAGSKPRVL